MRKMRSPAFSTICGTPGAKRNVRLCSVECTSISGKNGMHMPKSPSMVRRNDFIPNCQRTIRGCWWNAPFHFTTARLTGNDLMIRKYMSVVNVVRNRLRYRFRQMPTPMNITAMWMMTVTENGVPSVRVIYIFVPKPNSSKKCRLGGNPVIPLPRNEFQD